MIYPQRCDEHMPNKVPGCRPCQDAWMRYHRQRADVLPPGPFRTEADDAYAARLVARLRQLSEWEIARYCEQVLRAHAGPSIEVRPERRREPRQESRAA